MRDSGSVHKNGGTQIGFIEESLERKKRQEEKRRKKKHVTRNYSRLCL
jgi:hypothetical protein